MQNAELAAALDDVADPARLPGIGPRMSAHLCELVETGALGVLEELGRSFPRGLVELTRVPGLGPKKVL